MWEDEQKRRAEYVDWLKPGKRAEFINGEIVLKSPSKSIDSQVLKRIMLLLDVHIRFEKSGSIAFVSNLCRFPRNDYMPDFAFFDKKNSAKITGETTVFPIPQLIVEVLSVTAAYFIRTIKFRDYAVNGVKEYWIVDTFLDQIEQYILKDGDYILNKKHDVSSTLTSEVLVNFTAPVAAFFNRKINTETMRKYRNPKRTGSKV